MNYSTYKKYIFKSMRYEKIIAILFSSFIACMSAYTQTKGEYIFKHIDQSDGLLDNSVAYFSQDARGFIWIVTHNGLQRFDGSSFLNYPYNPRNADGIDYISGGPLDFYCDVKTNQLWISDKKIKQMDLNRATDSVYGASQMVTNPKFGFQSYTDSLNNIWYAGDFGVLKTDPLTKRINPFYLIAPHSASAISRRIFIDKQNQQIWMGGPDGLLLFDKTTKRVYSQNYNPLRHPLLEKLKGFHNAILFADRENNIWLSSPSNSTIFIRYNRITQKINTYSLLSIRHSLIYKEGPAAKSKGNFAPLSVYSFFEDNHGIIWISTGYAGLLKYNKASDNFSVVGEGNKKETRIEYAYDIFTIFQDKDENIWLGTDKGISIFNPYRQSLCFIRHDEYKTSALPKNEINACIETLNGNVLAGTWGSGITVLDNQLRFQKNIHFDKTQDYNL